jgi:hypothetical protein
VPLSVIACWLVVIGGISNPMVFVIAAFNPKFWEDSFWKIYTAVSFVITTIGFGWIGISLLQFSL